MKRTSFILSIALAIGCALAAHRAGAQDPPEAPVDAAKKRYEASYQRAIDFLIEHQGQKLESDGQAADRQSPRDKLRPLVEETFEARQRLQQAELKELRRRLAEIEQAIETREKNRDVIVNSRVDELLHAPAKSGSLPLPGSPESPAAAIPPPPGTAARVRYIQETVEENGELITRRKPLNEYETVPWPEDLDDQPPAATGEGRSPASAVGEFDLDTRERLARLDVQMAEAESEAATADVRLLQQMFERGAASQSALAERKKEQRQAEYQFKRAKLKLEGLAARRVDLEAAAEAAVAEMQGERQKAAATVASAEANLAATSAQQEKMGADIEAAKANYAFREKNYARMQKLFEVKSIEAQVLDEAEEQRAAAKAALHGANSAVATAKANVEQAKSAIEEAQAAFNVAELRLKAAQARHDRLLQRPAPEKPAPQGSNPNPSQTQDKASE